MINLFFGTLFGGMRIRYRYLKKAYKAGYQDGKKAGITHGYSGALDDIEEMVDEDSRH